MNCWMKREQDNDELWKWGSAVWRLLCRAPISCTPTFAYHRCLGSSASHEALENVGGARGNGVGAHVDPARACARPLLLSQPFPSMGTDGDLRFPRATVIGRTVCPAMAFAAAETLLAARPPVLGWRMRHPVQLCVRPLPQRRSECENHGMRELLVVFVFLLLAGSTVSADDGWPMQGGGATHAYSTSSTLPGGPPRLRWKFQLPRVANVRVPVSAALRKAKRADSQFHGIDLEGPSRTCFFQPVVQSNVLVAGCASGDVYALGARSGCRLWSRRVQAPVGTLCADSGHVYVPCGDGRLVCYDLRTGALVWQIRLSAFSYCALADGVIYAGNPLHVYAIRARSGRLLWQRSNDAASYHVMFPTARVDRLGNVISDSMIQGERLARVYLPMVYDGKVYVPCLTGQLLARDIRDGTLMRNGAGEAWASGPLHLGFYRGHDFLSDVQGYAASGGVVLFETRDRCVGFSSKTGKLLWSLKSLNAQKFGLTVSDDGFLLLHPGGTSSDDWRSLKTGRVSHALSKSAETFSHLAALANGTLVFACPSRNSPRTRRLVRGLSLLARKWKQEAELWSVQVWVGDDTLIVEGECIAMRPVVACGVVFVVAPDGRIYAFGR